MKDRAFSILTRRAGRSTFVVFVFLIFALVLFNIWKIGSILKELSAPLPTVSVEEGYGLDDKDLSEFVKNRDFMEKGGVISLSHNLQEGWQTYVVIGDVLAIEDIPETSYRTVVISENNEVVFIGVMEKNKLPGLFIYDTQRVRKVLRKESFGDLVKEGQRVLVKPLFKESGEPVLTELGFPLIDKIIVSL